MFWKTLKESNKNGRPKIAVIGDLIVDEYFVLDKVKQAQEADIPVFAVKDEVYVRGGSGNVSRQLQHWNTWVKHFYIPSGNDIYIPTKQRYLYEGKIIQRIDKEFPNYGSKDLSAHRKQVFARFLEALEEGLDVVIISDYGKGLFTAPQFLVSVIEACERHNVISIADPHNGTEPKYFNGVTVFKPNSDYYRRFHPTMNNCGSLLVTMGSKPPEIWYKDGRNPYQCRPRQPIEAKSVIGAGDCFTAHLALALAHKLSITDACEIAYSAGRAYVQHLFNEPPLPSEVYADLDKTYSKIVDIDDLLIIQAYRPAKMVFTNGCFDLLHAGHINFLQEARKLGDRLIVAVNSDESIRRIKGSNRPVIHQEQRLEMLAALECVDYVLLMDEDNPIPLLETFKPEVLTKGSTSSIIVGEEVVKSYSGQVVKICSRCQQSTSKIISEIAQLV